MLITSYGSTQSNLSGLSQTLVYSHAAGYRFQLTTLGNTWILLHPMPQKGVLQGSPGYKKAAHFPWSHPGV